MGYSAIDKALWAAGFAGHVALLFVLLSRGRWRAFPAFTTLIGFNAGLTVTLFLLYRYGLRVWYAHVYWWSDAVDVSLQIAVVCEIAGAVLRPAGTWARDALRLFLLLGVSGAILAALLAWGVAPPHLSLKQVWEVRGSLFTSLLTCELVMSVGLTAAWLRLGWRKHVRAVAQGLGGWALTASFLDGIQSYVGAAVRFATLDRIRIIVYCLALGYWIIQFWLPKSAGKPICPESRDYILALRSRVSYDLDRIDAES